MKINWHFLTYNTHIPAQVLQLGTGIVSKAQNADRVETIARHIIRKKVKII